LITHPTRVLLYGILNLLVIISMRYQLKELGGIQMSRVGNLDKMVRDGRIEFTHRTDCQCDCCSQMILRGMPRPPRQAAVEGRTNKGRILRENNSV